MKKKGFTLVELLGVIVILGVVLGLAVLAFINNQGGVNKTYYKTLEESLLIPGGDYFNYNKGEQPGSYGDEKRVSAQILKNGGYLEEELVGADKEPCDLQNSYVGAYKNSKDKTNYYACLVCGEYKTDSTSCNGEIDYTLGVRANKKESKDVYKTDGKSWSNEDIVLTFETLNDMEEVELETESEERVGSCKLEEVRGIKSCTIEVTESGNYKAYAKNGKSETKKKDLNILIDKTEPEFEFQEKGVDGKVEVVVEDTSLEKVIKNRIYDIKDNESGIKSIEYSLEEENSKDNYHDKGIVESFDVEKNLKMGIHYLKVRVTNNAGMTNEKVLEYIMQKRIIVKAINQAITYGDTFNSTDISKVEVTGLLSGDKVSEITLNHDEKLNTENKRLIYPSNIKIKRGEQDVTVYYKAEYQTGELTINPKITFTVEGTSEQSGYQVGAEVTVTCESIDEITSFDVTDDLNNTVNSSGGLIQSNKVTLNTNGKNRTVKGVCKSAYGSSEQSSQYHIYVYSQDNACSCQTAKTCKSSCCGTYSCNCKNKCTKYTWDYFGQGAGQYSGSSCPSGLRKCDGSGTYTCYSNCHCSKSKKVCSTCNNSCTKESCCGCKTRNSCWHL